MNDLWTRYNHAKQQTHGGLPGWDVAEDTGADTGGVAETVKEAGGLGGRVPLPPLLERLSVSSWPPP